MAASCSGMATCTRVDSAWNHIIADERIAVGAASAHASLYTSLRTWLRLADRPARRRIGAMKALRGNDGEERAGQRESRLHHSLSPVFLPWSGRLVANNGPISCRRSGNTKERPKQKSNPLRSRLSHGPLMRDVAEDRATRPRQTSMPSLPRTAGREGRCPCVGARKLPCSV